MQFKAGQKIEITRKAHAYSHSGYTDPTTIIPETKEVMTVRRVIHSKKNGTIVWFYRNDNTGYGIDDCENTTRFSFRQV